MPLIPNSIHLFATEWKLFELTENNWKELLTCEIIHDTNKFLIIFNVYNLRMFLHP
jgi:hypothetical protein